MPEYSVTRSISARPEVVWPILINPAQLADGSFSILRIDGEIAERQQITLWSEVNPKQAFRIQVSKVEPPLRMVWQSGMPLGLFTGRREFLLSQTAEGTEFTMRETYTGPMAGMMFRLIPDLGPSFEKFADGLKTAAERAAS